MNHYETLATPTTSVEYCEEHRQTVEAAVNAWKVEGKDFAQSEYDGVFTDDEIETAIDKLPLYKAADGEDVVGELIRNGGSCLRSLLLRLINWVWQLETVPEQWGSGIIVNLFKAGDASDPGNYRGITLIPIIRKLFSTMIRLRLQEKMELHESQAAFRAKRSCIDHIFTLSQIVNQSGFVGKSLYVFFLDIKKAYDSVWREGLFYKLLAKGVKGKMWRVLLDMFSKARSCVRVAGELSEQFDIHVGVGQGDPLSTLLFDIFIDDLLLDLHNTQENSGVQIADGLTVCATTYADDVGGISHEPQGLQEIINHVGQWLNKWRMQANAVKSVVMVFHPQQGQAASVPMEQRTHTWTLNGQTLSQVDTYKYLGVYFTENGSWDLHASKALGKMRAALGYWKPLLSCQRVPVRARAMMIQTLIYSSVLYGSEVWSATCATRKAYDVVAKEAIRSVMGLHRCEASSDALFADLGLLPPSLLIDAAKQCYLQHLNSLSGGRWCKAAVACRFGGTRSAGRPQVGANWLGEVQKCSRNICKDLNIADLSTPIGDQPPVRRVSNRISHRGSLNGVRVSDIEVEPSIGTESLNRKTVLDVFWAWNAKQVKAKYVTVPATESTWFAACVDPLQRGRSSYLSSLPSFKSRAILSARSGKLFSLRTRLVAGETSFVPATDYRCNDCDEHLGGSKQACIHCMVDCPVMWPKLEHFFATISSLGEVGADYANKLKTLNDEDLVTAMIIPERNFLPKELTGPYWSALADFLVCNASADAGQDLAQEGHSGQASSGAIQGLADGVLDVCGNSQVLLGDANVHEDAVI
jgi:hypothetical protein